MLQKENLEWKKFHCEMVSLSSDWNYSSNKIVLENKKITIKNILKSCLMGKLGSVLVVGLNNNWFFIGTLPPSKCLQMLLPFFWEFCGANIILHLPRISNKVARSKQRNQASFLFKKKMSASISFNCKFGPSCCYWWNFTRWRNLTSCWVAVWFLTCKGHTLSIALSFQECKKVWFFDNMRTLLQTTLNWSLSNFSKKITLNLKQNCVTTCDRSE